MRIDIVCAALPPKLDGIGDYTANLTSEIAKSCQVRILTTAGPYTPIPGVCIEEVFSVEEPESVRNLVHSIEADPPDCLLVQFNQFSYGRWGWNPYLPLTLRRLRRQFPNMRQVVMMHEDFVPIINWKFAIMTTWQRWQFRALGCNADVVLFSIDPWAQRYRSWFPGRTVVHLPVGSNISPVSISREEARQRLGIGQETAVIGLFGTAHATRLLGMARAVAEAATASARSPVSRYRDIMVLYIGPHGDAVRTAMAGHPMITDGPLPSDEVSRRLAAIDVYLAPYQDGVSTRRGAMMAGLQHGLATVGTRGELTDSMLDEQHGRTLLLADVSSQDDFVTAALSLLDDDDQRHTMGQAASQWYHQEFAWPIIAEKLLKVISPSPPPTPTSPSGGEGGLLN